MEIRIDPLLVTMSKIGTFSAQSYRPMAGKGLVIVNISINTSHFEIRLPQAAASFRRYQPDMVLTKSQEQNSARLLIGMSLAVLGIGFLCWESWNPKIENQSNTAHAAQPSAWQKEQMRKPASLPPLSKFAATPETLNVSAEKSKAMNLLMKHDLRCPIKNSKAYVTAPAVTVTGGFVQLQGKSCFPTLNSKTPEITNLTNGFKGTYFKAGGGYYKTDLIQLNPGKNTIRVEAEDLKGKKIEISILVVSHRI